MMVKAIVLATFIISVSATTVLDNLTYIEGTDIYTSKFDIVKIHLSRLAGIVFFVEQDLQNGDYKGLFTTQVDPTDHSWLHPKRIVKEILQNGKCVASDNHTVFIGADDGIYTYNFETNQAIKFGNVTLDVTDIQKHSKEDILYIINNNRLKKITEQGTNVDIVESVRDVQEIVLDRSDNIYLYEKDTVTNKYKARVIANDTVLDVENLPDYKTIQITKGFDLTEGTLFILDNRIYRVFANGTSVRTSFVFENAPTGYSLDSGFVQFFGHDNKLYAYSNFEKFIISKVEGFAKLYWSIYENHTEIYVDKEYYN